jgi:hypothetical protein
VKDSATAVRFLGRRKNRKIDLLAISEGVGGGGGVQ